MHTKKILNHQDNYKWRREVATAEYLAMARRKKTRSDAVPNIWGCFLKISTEVSMLILLFFIIIFNFFKRLSAFVSLKCAVFGLVSSMSETCHFLHYYNV